MILYNCRVNAVQDPVGYELTQAVVSWAVKDSRSKRQLTARIEVADNPEMERPLFDTGFSRKIDNRGYALPLALKPRTRYYYRVRVRGDRDEAVSGVHFFETAKLHEPWTARWLTVTEPPPTHPEFRRTVSVKKKVKSARVYCAGLGLYELSVDGKKVGDEYFSPNYTDYGKSIQYQTFDVTDALEQGVHTLSVLLGNGWYKGAFGLDSKVNMYGDKFMLIAELHLAYLDGTNEVIATDGTWTAWTSEIRDSGFYLGEVLDATHETKELTVTRTDGPTKLLRARLSLPVRVKQSIEPVESTPSKNGDVLIDFGQNMTGIVRVKLHEKAGRQVRIRFGEVLQQGAFYNENYRAAKTELVFISDGKPRTLEPKFTACGFRYISVSGMERTKPSDFEALVLYSDFADNGTVQTSDAKINRLIENIRYGIMGNSLDIPTDCPQRDERMGWTGDCQAISKTALYLFDMRGFYSKWLCDVTAAQAPNGCVPDVVPRAGYGGEGACGWADAATIVPYNVFLMSGDVSVLRRQYGSMKAWVEYIRNHNKTDGACLRSPAFQRHYGDWLALDHPKHEENNDYVEGYTDHGFLCSAYYAYSAALTAKAAKVLKNRRDAHEYARLAGRIKRAVYETYLKTPRPETATQTAYLMALALELVPKGKRDVFIQRLREKFGADGDILKTGFSGTIFSLNTLTDCGLPALAFSLFLREQYPGWLYAVNLGATTIWERWNSLMPDGSVNKSGMNSFNHYAYGCVGDWLISRAAGLRPSAHEPGFKHAILKPHPDSRLPRVHAALETAMGRYESGYQIDDAGRITYRFTVPFNCTAQAYIKAEKAQFSAAERRRYRLSVRGEYLVLTLTNGAYSFTGQPRGTNFT